MMELDLEETISQLKKIFSNSAPSKRIYPISNEQKQYVKKLNILFGGFHAYLKDDKELTIKKVNAIMDNIEIFLQIFHLDYSEAVLCELDIEEISYYLHDFLPRKWLDFSKKNLKSMCESLKRFISFLRETLHYYPNEIVFKKMIDALNAEQVIDTLDWDEEEPNENTDDLLKGYSLKYKGFEGEKVFYSLENENGEPPSTEIISNFLKLIESFRKVREEKEQSDMEGKKKKFFDSIKLENELKPWYTSEEIKVGKLILKEVFNNFHALKTLNKNGLLAAIDHALSEIYSKKVTQSAIAKRHHTSSTTLINHRYIIAPCIPLEYFYPLFISEEDLKAGKEKTYIFKVNMFSSRNYKVIKTNEQNLYKFELVESNTLDDLHETIQQFIIGDDYGEHLYSFFLNGKEWDNDSEYAGPPEFQQERGAKHTDIQLKDLKFGYKQRFLYLYDYGDCIRYNITVIGLGIYNDDKIYPHLIK
ncbi:MAG: IS1096 element passenger TnpR family protein [Promethearchaeota archaeon]